MPSLMKTLTYETPCYRSWNVLGLQGALAARIFQPVYLDEIVIGDVPRDLRETVREDCERAFFERLEGIDRKPQLHFPLNKSLFEKSYRALW